MPNTKTETIKCPKCKQHILGTWMKASSERMCIWCGHDFAVAKRQTKEREIEDASACD